MSEKVFWNQTGVERLMGATTTPAKEEGGEPVKEGGKMITFYPLPIGPLVEFKDTCKAAAPFILLCFEDKNRDFDSDTVDTVTEVGGEIYPVKNITVKAVSPTTSSHRLKQKKDAVAELLDTIFAENTRNMLATLIISSASDEFTEESRNMLLTEAPIHVFLELLSGVMAASAGAYEGLGEFLPRLLQNQLAVGVASAKEKLNPTIPSSETET